MPILLPPDPAPQPVTQAMVDAVMTQAKAHCAPSTWTKFVSSLKANKFGFIVK